MVENIFLLLVDDCTRMLSVSMMKQKSEAFEAFKNFKIQVEKEKYLKIVCLRTENGGEFISKVFSSICTKNGIKRQYSAPYTPQQNGVVEKEKHDSVGHDSHHDKRQESS